METAAPPAPESHRDRFVQARERFDQQWRGAPTWQKVLAIVLLAIVVLIAVWDWNWFKGPIERRVEAATGREFAIEGDLDVDLHWTRPVVIANDVMLGNAAWSETDDEMFRVDQARITWAFWHAFRGEWRLPRVELDRPNLLFERDAEARANWRFDDEPGDEPDYPEIGQLLVDGGRFRLLEPIHKTDILVFVQSGEPEADDALAPLLLTGDGRYRDGEFELEGRVDSPVEFIDQDEAWRVDLRARAGATKAHAHGGLALRWTWPTFRSASNWPAPTCRICTTCSGWRSRKRRRTSWKARSRATARSGTTATSTASSATRTSRATRASTPAAPG